jgi:hypothetical protein
MTTSQRMLCARSFTRWLPELFLAAICSRWSKQKEKGSGELGSPAPCNLGDVAYSWKEPVSYRSTPASDTTASESPQYPAIKTAATSDGGCVSLLLTPPGSVGSNGLPEMIRSSTESEVKVGSYFGEVGIPQQILGTRAAGAKEVVLQVQIPRSGGQIQELVVIAIGLTEDQLVSIVSQGLQ